MAVETMNSSRYSKTIEMKPLAKSRGTVDCGQWRKYKRQDEDLSILIPYTKYYSD